jgi:hypothetical protein
MKAVKHRNEQFENIQRLKDEYEAAGNPIVSMDTKKKGDYSAKKIVEIIGFMV